MANKPISMDDLFGTRELAYGQVVIVTARWILVLAGLLLALWNPSPINELRIQLFVLLLLAFGNFYLHAQLLMRRPTLAAVAYAASAADVVIITILVITNGGFKSGLFIFYFPALLALSVAFPTLMTFFYTATVTGFYFLISVATTSQLDDFQLILTRLIIFAAVAFCGNLYWRIERGRREAALEGQKALKAQLLERSALGATQP